MSELCEEIIGENKNIELLVDQTHSILKSSLISIVTSNCNSRATFLKHLKLFVTKQTVSLFYF